MTAVFVDLLSGDLELAFTVRSFAPGYPPRGWDPGAGDELELSPIVAIHANGIEVGHTTLADAILTLASDRGWTLSRAERYVEDRCCEAAADDLSEREEQERDGWGVDAWERAL